jgi:hypothetical protein
MIAPFHHAILLQRVRYGELTSDSRLVVVLSEELGAEFVVAIGLHATHHPTEATLALTHLIASSASSLARISITHMKRL